MKKILLSLPLLGLSVLSAPLSMAGTCDNPIEKIDASTSHIYMECPLDITEQGTMVYPEGVEYDFFQSEYTRIENMLSELSANIAQFPTDINGMSDEEKRNELSRISEPLMYSFDSDLSYLKTQATDVDQKELIKKLQKKIGEVKTQYKAMKKKFNILDNQEFAVVQGVKDSFTNLTDNINETKEVYTMIESELSESEKKRATRAMKIVDGLYTKAKKQSDGIESAVKNRAENVDPWTLQTKYYNAENRVNTFIQLFAMSVLGEK